MGGKHPNFMRDGQTIVKRPQHPGHFVLPPVDLPIAGDWKLRFEVRFGSFDQYETTVNVPIRKD